MNVTLTWISSTTLSIDSLYLIHEGLRESQQYLYYITIIRRVPESFNSCIYCI